MSKIIEGTIRDVTRGQNLIGTYAFKLMIKTDTKLINIVDFAYDRQDVWTKKDIGRKGIFKYGWNLLGGRKLKNCKLNG